MTDSQTSSSPFQFQDPVVERSIFFENPNYDHNNDTEQALFFKTKAFTPRQTDGKSEAKVSLLVTNSERAFDINDIDPSLPYLVSVVMSATFYWGDDLSEELVPTLIKENAPALLLGYIRPLMTQLTSQSKFQSLRVPFINFQNSVLQEPDESF